MPLVSMPLVSMPLVSMPLVSMPLVSMPLVSGSLVLLLRYVGFLGVVFVVDENGVSLSALLIEVVEMTGSANSCSFAHPLHMPVRARARIHTFFCFLAGWWSLLKELEE